MKKRQIRHLITSLCIAIWMIVIPMMIQGEEVYHNDRTKMNFEVPKDWRVEKTEKWRSINLVHGELPVTVNIRMFIFPEFTTVDGVEEKSITINGFQIRRMTSRYDGWVNIKERPGLVAESLKANVSENYVAVYSKNILGSDLKVSKAIVGEYYYLTRNIGYIISIQSPLKHWKQIKDGAKLVVDSFWVGNGERPEVVLPKQPEAVKMMGWHMRGNGGANQNYSNADPDFSKVLEEVWMYDVTPVTGNVRIGDPIISEKQLFMTVDDHVMAFSNETGKLHWQYEMTGVLQNHMVYTEGILFVITQGERSYLYAIIPESGNVLYKKELKGKQFSIPIAQGKFLYMIEDSKINAYKVVNGKLRWSKDYDLNPEFFPVMTRKEFLVMTKKGELVSCSLRTGREKWKTTQLMNLVASPVVADDVIVLVGNVPSDEGGFLSHIQGLDVKTGELKWNFDRYSFSAFGAAPSVGNQRLFVPYRMGNNEEESSYLLVSLSLDKGDVVWEQTFDMPEKIDLIRPVVSRRAVSFNGGKGIFGGIYSFDIETGEPLSKTATITETAIDSVRFYKHYIYTVNKINDHIILKAHM